VDLVPLVFSSGWASGVNSYLVVLVLGIADRIGDFASLPDTLGRTDVVFAGGRAVRARVRDGQDPPRRLHLGRDLHRDQAGDRHRDRPARLRRCHLRAAGGDGALGGGTALASHLVKAGGRLAINASPEPVTNIVASLAEDVAVVGVVLLAIQHPWLALVVAALFLLIGGLVVDHLLRLVCRGWRRWKGRPAPA
jgi:hypothetical protein